MLNWQPMLDASPVIQIHAYAAILGFFVGGFVLLRKKGGPLHKFMGRCFAVLALMVALSSFFIHQIKMWGPFSWIHLLSIWTILGVLLAVKHIRKGNIRSHKQNMFGVYIGGFVIAGGFTFLPGRLMHQVFF